MTEETKQKLIDAGRKDLVEIYEINQSGYAGVLPTGEIVDRRKKANAIPIPKNELLGIPSPKPYPPPLQRCNKHYMFYNPDDGGCELCRVEASNEGMN